jgi:hypothetical protein
MERKPLMEHKQHHQHSPGLVSALARMQVLVPVALMQPDQGTVGGQAYMLVNRDDFPAMMGGHGMMLPPGHASHMDHKQQHHHDMMDVLVGAANRVEGGEQHGGQHGGHHEDGDEDELDEDSKAVEKQPLTTRSGRKRNPSRSF